MQLTSKSFRDGASIPGEFAFAVIDPVNHIALSTNRNPHLAWSDVPAGIKSFALICHDADVPSGGEDVNKEDREIAESFCGARFFQLVIVGFSIGYWWISRQAFAKFLRAATAMALLRRVKRGLLVPTGRATV
jgi:hypothetical protein